MQMNQEDRDRLIRIDTNLDNHIKQMESHVNEDKEAFGLMRGQVGWLQKITFMALGALALIQFLKK